MSDLNFPHQLGNPTPTVPPNSLRSPTFFFFFVHFLGGGIVHLPIKSPNEMQCIKELIKKLMWFKQKCVCTAHKRPQQLSAVKWCHC